MTDQNPSEAASTPVPENPVYTARAYRNYRLIRYALVLFMLYYGGASIRDGFFKYPQEQRDAIQNGVDPDKLPRRGLDIPLNRAFGIGLPPLALFILGWALYSSRGEFRFDGTTLTAPGHPPVPVSAITEIDRSKWARKSIAYILYKIPETGETGRIKIDHALYDPIDTLYKAVEAAVQGTSAVGGVEDLIV